jgi:hypothetical protein
MQYPVHHQGQGCYDVFRQLVNHVHGCNVSNGEGMQNLIMTNNSNAQRMV